MKLIIDVDDNDYELLNKTGIEIDWNTACHGKEKDREMTFAIFDLVKALKNGIPYEEKPQGEQIAWEQGYECGKNESRPQGEWKLHGMIYYCSECGHECGESGDNFCGNCGADMRGKEE